MNVQQLVLPLQKIRTAIRQLSEHGYPRIEQVAKKVGIKQRTLQRRLLAAGTSFRQLVHERRFRLATKLLEDPNVPIASMASKLGFAGHPSFCRAVNEEWVEDQEQPIDGDMMGTGPYELEEYEPDFEAVFTRASDGHTVTNDPAAPKPSSVIVTTM